jgi:hypothetical protein
MIYELTYINATGESKIICGEREAKRAIQRYMTEGLHDGCNGLAVKRTGSSVVEVFHDNKPR